MATTALRRACGPGISPRDDLQPVDIQHRFGQHLLELGVFRLQRLQALRIRHVHAAEIPAPQVRRRIAEAMPAAQLLDRRPRRCLLQETDDLLVSEPLLHVRPLLGTDSPYISLARKTGGRSEVRALMDELNGTMGAPCAVRWMRYRASSGKRQ